MFWVNSSSQGLYNTVFSFVIRHFKIRQRGRRQRQQEVEINIRIKGCEKNNVCTHTIMTSRNIPAIDYI